MTATEDPKHASQGTCLVQTLGNDPVIYRDSSMLYLCDPHEGVNRDEGNVHIMPEDAHIAIGGTPKSSCFEDIPSHACHHFRDGIQSGDPNTAIVCALEGITFTASEKAHIDSEEKPVDRTKPYNSVFQIGSFRSDRGAPFTTILSSLSKWETVDIVYTYPHSTTMEIDRVQKMRMCVGEAIGDFLDLNLGNDDSAADVFRQENRISGDYYKLGTEGTGMYNVTIGRHLLPIGWESAFDDTYKRMYYFNRTTEERRWKWPGPLPMGRESAFNDTHERTYYSNRTTREITGGAQLLEVRSTILLWVSGTGILAACQLCRDSAGGFDP